VISMFLAFFAWYAGLARGGVAKVGQVQLAQPVLTLVWSAFVLHEPVGWLTVIAAIAVLTCVVWTQRSRA
jgi:drug/metabolite transporter (DMT)-like permease